MVRDIPEIITTEVFLTCGCTPGVDEVAAGGKEWGSSDRIESLMLGASYSCLRKVRLACKAHAAPTSGEKCTFHKTKCTRSQEEETSFWGVFSLSQLIIFIPALRVIGCVATTEEWSVLLASLGQMTKALPCQLAHSPSCHSTTRQVPTILRLWWRFYQSGFLGGGATLALLSRKEFM